MGVRLDKQCLRSIIVCFWKDEGGKWEGVVHPRYNEIDKKVKILSSEQAVLVLDWEYINGTDKPSI